MNYEDVQNKVKNIINKKFLNQNLDENTNLFKDLDMDSLDYAEIVIELEYIFQTDVLEKQISWQNIKTIGQLSMLFFENLNT